MPNPISNPAPEAPKKETAPKVEIRIPITGLPAEPLLYMIRKVLFHAGDAARNVGNKEHARAFEEAGRGARAV